jgi:hypothetical protein
VPQKIEWMLAFLCEADNLSPEWRPVFQGLANSALRGGVICRVNDFEPGY